MIATPIARHLVRFGVRPCDDVAPMPEVDRFKPTLVAEPRSDLATLLAGARAEGRQDGEAAVEARLSAERERVEIEIAAARQSWCAEQADRLASLLETAVAELHSKMSDSVAAILTPFVTESARDRAVEELAAAVSFIIRDKAEAPVRIDGPADLVAALVARLGDTPSIQVSARDDAQDMTVEVGPTLIESLLGIWAEQLQRARE